MCVGGGIVTRRKDEELGGGGEFDTGKPGVSRFRLKTNAEGGGCRGIEKG